MLFNSIDFAIFLPIVFVLYWFVTNKNLRLQNILLLFSSYFFYACWDWRFLFLLLFSTLLDYLTGIKMSEAQTQRVKKCWFWASISINLGFLGVFKYYNFFADSFAEALTAIGLQVNPWSLQIILPVGISFYTFHGLSYVIDIYKGHIKAEKNFVDYSVFVSFFPLLVAGPIERATHLLPQIQTKRVFNYAKAVDGLRQILWGLFKKVVIADQCAEYVNMTFSHTNEYSGSTLFLGGLFFTLQVYGDFSGYSDIALGTARLFGIELLKNFAFPFFSRDMAEFWRRWHISLSTWFRDYLYIPLGGSKGNLSVKVRNTFIIFLVSGFWHGANWTFILWGLLHALFIMPSVIFKTNRNYMNTVAEGRLFPSWKEALAMFTTFNMLLFSLVIFRSDSITHAINYLSRLFTKDLWAMPSLEPNPILIVLIIGCFIIEWLGREDEYAIAKWIDHWPKAMRWGLYTGIFWVIFNFAGSKQEFIYFQF